jgi:hypothetical protein
MKIYAIRLKVNLDDEAANPIFTILDVRVTAGNPQPPKRQPGREQGESEAGSL